MSEAAWLDWTVTRALPLWTGPGFNSGLGLFEEQLQFDGTPVETVPLRLMVQCRQIAVLCVAERRGWITGGVTLASAVGEAIARRFFEADGAPGWIFSIDRTGAPVRRDRDLYTHAFVLFALAWLTRSAPTEHVTKLIDATIRFLDDDDRRTPRQDPHMHLFEAYLELFAATRDPAYLTRAAAVKAYAIEHFFDAATGVLHEEIGHEQVEPGHNFEWAWLLRRFDALADKTPDPLADRLVETALRHGTDRRTGRIIDERQRSSSRLWPHAEALRALAAGSLALLEREALSKLIIERLLKHYCPASLNGGWIDRLDEADRPLGTTMPASSLYHLVFALDAAMPESRSLSAHSRSAASSS